MKNNERNTGILNVAAAAADIIEKAHVRPEKARGYVGAWALVARGRFISRVQHSSFSMQSDPKFMTIL